MTDARCHCCDEALVPGTCGAAAFGRCPRCIGVAVEMRHLVPMLEALTKQLRGEIDLHAHLDPVADPRRSDGCPRCAGAMESFGYMGTKLAWPQRCGRCLVVWIDDEQMGALCMLYARTTARRAAIERDAREEEEASSRRMRLVMAGRAAGDMLGRGILM